MVQFVTRRARRQANITAARAKDHGMTEIRRFPRGQVQARLHDTLYLFDADGSLAFTKAVEEVNPYSQQTQFAMDPRNPQHHAWADRGRDVRPTIEGYDEPTVGPRAAIHKPDFVEPNPGRRVDLSQARVRANMLIAANRAMRDLVL